MWVDRRCFRAVDPLSDGEPELIAIDEESSHEIVHRRRFGKANGATHETLNPGPQSNVFALDCLCVLFSDLMLLGVDIPLIGTPAIGIEARDTKWLQQGLQLQKDPILALSKDISQDLATVMGVVA